MKQAKLSLLLAAIVVCVIATLGYPQKNKSRDITLGEARNQLGGKKIVITGKVSEAHDLKGYLYDWYLAVERGGEYRPVGGLDGYLPASYQGQEAEVVVIQINYLKKEKGGAGQSNALGEVVNDTLLINPYSDVVVKFLDGKMAMITGYLSGLIDSSEFTRPFRLLSEKNNRTELVSSQLPSVIGRTVYAVAYSRLYLPTASLKEMSPLAKYSRQQAFDFPRLEPLTIVAAKYSSEQDMVILKLKDQSGKEYLTLSRFEQKGEGKRDVLASIVDSFPAGLLASIAGFTAKDIAAIRQGNITVGMSRTAVYCTIGFPDQKNDWGRGGQQLVYFGGRIFVYIDANDRVKDWQNLGK